MKIEMTNREFLDFANGIADCKVAITSGKINSNRMFSFYIDSTMNKLREDVLLLEKHLEEELAVEGSKAYYSAHDKLVEGKWVPDGATGEETPDELNLAFSTQFEDIRKQIVAKRESAKEFMGMTREVEITQISFKSVPDDMHDSTLFSKVFKETEEEILEMIANG